MSSPFKFDANLSTTLSATIIDLPPRTLTGAVAMPRSRPTPRACLAPVLFDSPKYLARDPRAKDGSFQPFPNIRPVSLPDYGRTEASSPRDGPRRHFLQGEGSEGFGPMVPPSSGDGHRGYGGPLHVERWEGREGQRGHGLVHLPRGDQVLRRGWCLVHDQLPREGL